MREAMLDRLEQEFLEKGERQVMSLIKILMDNNRLDNVKKAAEDDTYRKKLCQEIFTSDK